MNVLHNLYEMLVKIFHVVANILYIIYIIYILYLKTSSTHSWINGTA